MGPSQAGGPPRIRTILPCLAAVAFVAVHLPFEARTADITISSKTYLLYYERDVAAGESQTFAPVYEFLAADARDLGGKPLSFHFYGWGRQDLGDHSGEDRRSGELGAAYLLYVHPQGNAEARLGRFSLTEGVAAEIVDGAFVKLRTPLGIGLSAFGGVPVEYSITGTEKGDSIYGGRLFLAAPGFVEVGASYLREKGDFRGDDREQVGGDLWLRPGIPVELTARAVYNLSTEGFASQRYVLRLLPVARIDLSAGFETYAYKDLFQTALNPAFLPPAADNADEVSAYFAVVDVKVASWVALEAALRSIRHDLADPGDADRAELGARFVYNDKKDVAGLSAAVVTGDRAENEYGEYRAFASYSPGDWRFTVDGLTHRYKEAILGVKDAYHAVASAGRRLIASLRISGDVTYNRSPRFKEDYAGLVKASLDFGGSTGGKK